MSDISKDAAVFRLRSNAGDERGTRRASRLSSQSTSLAVTSSRVNVLWQTLAAVVDRQAGVALAERLANAALAAEAQHDALSQTVTTVSDSASLSPLPANSATPARSGQGTCVPAQQSVSAVCSETAPLAGGLLRCSNSGRGGCLQRDVVVQRWRAHASRPVACRIYFWLLIIMAATGTLFTYAFNVDLLWIRILAGLHTAACVGSLILDAIVGPPHTGPLLNEQTVQMLGPRLMALTIFFGAGGAFIAWSCAHPSQITAECAGAIVIMLSTLLHCRTLGKGFDQGITPHIDAGS